MVTAMSLFSAVSALWSESDVWRLSVTVGAVMHLLPCCTISKTGLRVPSCLNWIFANGKSAHLLLVLSMATVGACVNPEYVLAVSNVIFCTVPLSTTHVLPLHFVVDAS